MEKTPKTALDNYSLARHGKRFLAEHNETGAQIGLMVTREELRSVGRLMWRMHIRLMDKGNGVFGVFSEEPIVKVDEDELFDDLLDEADDESEAEAEPTSATARRGRPRKATADKAPF